MESFIIFLVIYLCLIKTNPLNFNLLKNKIIYKFH